MVEDIGFGDVQIDQEVGDFYVLNKLSDHIFMGKQLLRLRCRQFPWAIRSQQLKPLGVNVELLRWMGLPQDSVLQPSVGAFLIGMDRCLIYRAILG